MPAHPHPIAKPEQHDHERAALELTKHPIVKDAYERVKAHWLAQADPTPGMRACFDGAFDEVMFSAAVWSSNQDPLRPKVITITRLAHPLGDLHIPGSRWGIDNPDSVYRVIPISGDERYVIHGRVAEKRMTENYFTLWDDRMNTVDVLSGHDLELRPDRTFTVTVDSDSANGRPNHIQSSAAAQEFYIRDAMLDWATHTPTELSINSAQSVANPGGSYTYVLSKHDPGVHNWLDPCGLSDGVLTLRWAEFPGGRPNEHLAVRSEVVPVSTLRNRLPEATKWMTD